MIQLSVLHPKHPERICWGCEKYCSATDLACGNGTIRTPHPDELFGVDEETESSLTPASSAPRASEHPVPA